MYTTMKYQFVLHDKTIVRVTSNQLQPPIPCFKPHNTSLVVVVACRTRFFNLCVVVIVSHRICTNLKKFFSILWSQM